VRVAYNAINLPQQVQLLGSRGIKNMYAADGRKLKTEAKQGSEYIKEGTKTYSGNLVFDINDELDYIIFPEGRIIYNATDSSFNFEYHLRDHLGSTRVAFVPTANGTEVVQENSYYPFGAPIADLSWSPKSTNRYKREGKEYIADFDWNKYDFTGRTFDTWTLRTLQVDPMATEYYSTSPYALWLNNPLRVIDPTGMWADDPENLSWWDKFKQFLSQFGIGEFYEREEQVNTKQTDKQADNYVQLQDWANTGKENQKKAQEIADYIPFVGASFKMSEGMVKDDNAIFATGLGMLVVDMAGGGILKGAGKAVTKGVTVLGSYNPITGGYVSLAKKIGAHYFEIPANIWTKMTPSERWIANQRFLDRVVARGDNIRLSNSAFSAKAGTSFYNELQYLYSKGYKPTSDGMSLVKP
jgi:RHS repeat-associated protein